jgi:hypothetical protein
LPSGLETLVLSKDHVHAIDEVAEQFNPTACDNQIGSLLASYRGGGMRPKALDISYTTSFPDHVNEFVFHEIAEKCTSSGIHFDYVIDVST